MKSAAWKLINLSLSLGLLYSCKVSQPVQPAPVTISAGDTLKMTIVDSVQVKPDSVVVVVRDTLPEIQYPDTVDLQVYKLEPDTVTIIGVGDIMMGTNFPSANYLPPNNGRDLLADVIPVLQNADVTFGNLEGVILDEGGIQKHCSNPDLCYLFRTPEKYVHHLLAAGFDVMSLANNHAGDFGNPGRENTMRVLKQAGLNFAGLLSIPYTTFEQNGVKYGFAAFAPNTGTVSINDIPNAKNIVAHLDSISDIVIVSFHGGAEGKKHQHVTRETEYFYGENRGNVYKFAHELIDSGADVIFGHGPHVTRALEVYKNRFIIYSLGNFCTYARFNLSGENGIAPIMKVYTDKEGAFFKADIIPIYQPGEGGPQIDQQKRAIHSLQRLTHNDFPELKIIISDNGKVLAPDQEKILGKTRQK
ncbi:MAG: CapA family protein [Cyclobacteriaceae bacterium]